MTWYTAAVDEPGESGVSGLFHLEGRAHAALNAVDENCDCIYFVAPSLPTCRGWAR